MKRIVLAGVLCLFAASASAQTRVIIQNGTTPVATGNPFPVTCISGCSGGSGGAVTIADGADVTQGAIADAASTAGGTGTVNAHMRFLTSVAFATSTNQTSQITQETAINTVLGLQADAACATDNGVCTSIALFKRSNQQRTSILAAIGTPMQQTGGTVGLVAGSAIIGNVRIDQTTPGTTNGVVVNSSALPTGAATSANQTTSNTSLATIATNTTGAATAANQATMATNQTAVQGPVPAGGATATKFNLGGCEYRSTKPTITDGQQVPCQTGTRGSLIVQLGNADSTAALGSFSNGADAASNSFGGLPANSYNSLFNGTTWDRLRSIQGWAATGLGVLAAVPAPTSSANGANAYVSTTALAANQIVKGSAGNLYSFQVSADSTLSGAAWWVMIYDATTAPGDGAVTPAKCYAVPSGTTSYSAAFQMPIRLATGITIGVSTTGCFTKTASTHAFISGDAQ